MTCHRLGKVGVLSSTFWVCAAVLACESDPSDTPAVSDGKAQETSGSSFQSTSNEAATSGPLFGGGPNPVAQPSSTSGTSTNPPANAPAITACDKAVAEGSEPLIDDFDDGDQQTLKQDGRDSSWYFYDDGTVGTLQVNMNADPLAEREGIVLSVTGDGFSDWGSGFGVGMNWNDGQCTYDASVYGGVQFWVRGTGEARVILQNLSVRPVDLGGGCAADAVCFDSHGVSFGIPQEWTLMRLPFSEFSQVGWGTNVGPLHTDAIYLLEFQFGVVQPFAISLDEVSFFREGEPTDGGVSPGLTDASSVSEAPPADVVDASTTLGDAGEPLDSSVGIQLDAQGITLDADVR